VYEKKERVKMSAIELIVMGIFFAPLVFVILRAILDEIEGNKKPP